MANRKQKTVPVREAVAEESGPDPIGILATALADVEGDVQELWLVADEVGDRQGEIESSLEILVSELPGLAPGSGRSDPPPRPARPANSARTPT